MLPRGLIDLRPVDGVEEPEADVLAAVLSGPGSPGADPQQRLRVANVDVDFVLLAVLFCI